MSIPCVLDFASKAARRDVEEQAASAQTADPVEDAPKASERVVGLRFCCLKIPLQTVAFAPAGAGRAAAEDSSEERGSGQIPKADMFGKHGRKITGKQPCTRQDLDQRVRRLAIGEMETAQQAVKTLTAAVQTLTALWLEERQAGPSDEANALKKELEEAKKELEEAKKELRDAEQKYERPGFLVLFGTRTLPSTGVPARRVQARGLLRGHIA